MKRRKKLWIACAALAVVVGLCAFALLYRQRPYRFLDGAELNRVGISRYGLWYPPGRSPHDYACYEYKMTGTVQSVAAEAQSDLDPYDGWVWNLPSDASAVNRAEDAWVSIQVPKATSSNSSGVKVVVCGRATAYDRFQEWLHNR